MLKKSIRTRLIFYALIFLPIVSLAQAITISNPKITMTLDYGTKATINSLIVNGQKVISGTDGMFTSVSTGGKTYSSLHLKRSPVLIRAGSIIKLNGIEYGDNSLNIKENWVFTINNRSIKWTIERSSNKSMKAEESAAPVFNFDNINTWEGAYQGYGGLAWFYLFNEKMCTYGVHTRSSDFWNSKTGNGLNITVDAPGKNVAMKYSRTNEDKLAYTISTSDKELLPRTDSGTNRRRFVRGRTDVWAPFAIPSGTSIQTITLSYFDFQQKYGRGDLKGIDGDKVSAVLNTIARIGVIDSLHFGGNSWHTPYGPICLHEQYIAQMGLGINDPKYLKGYQSCLDYYCAHAIKPDGRVYPRWAYTNEDAMPNQFNKYGFYEAQWGILMDSNPDLVTNIAELYDMNGDKNWVKSHQADCEKALDWILKRDGNNNGLVEMMTDNHSQKKSSDWIDIIWASYENAFVNAKLYHALVKWTDIERQLNNAGKAKYYAAFAAKLKASFNKDMKDGGFWDAENGCYVHWRDKDGSIHGRNMVTPVNFMAIAYGICDNDARRKTILDNIEAQMQKEKLFFWPLCMTSYAQGEGNDWQFPFPSYENGDLFLSWGSVGVAAFAGYKPELALKYVKNVLEQYGKDGLAFQRYGRGKQDGQGDDILSGNSLSIVGLYQAIYGINPLYNRFYLDPHITSDLSGTLLNYNFRGKRLVIKLDSNSYSVSDKMFKVTAEKNFGFYATKNQLSYFKGNSANASLQATTVKRLTISVKNWDKDKMEWEQSAESPVTYVLHQLKPNAVYQLVINGGPANAIKSDQNGELV
ncbi:MAG: alpha-L-rhamnosidase-related protein, partial [Mucilaginibacter sp.]